MGWILVQGKNLKACEAFGATPLTAGRLADKTVHRMIGNENDVMNWFILDIQQATDLAVKFLNDIAYNEKLSEGQHQEDFQRRSPIRVYQKKSRQENIIGAVSHGTIFLATGGNQLPFDNVFNTAEMSVCKHTLKMLQDKKEHAGVLANVLARGMKVLNSSKEIDALKVPELVKILDFFDVEKKLHGNHAGRCTQGAELWSKLPSLGPQWTEN